MPKQAYRFGVESDEVFVYAEFAEPITATQKVPIVFRVKHVEHEIRWSVEYFVAHLTLFLPSIVHHCHQSGNLRFLRGQLDLCQNAHVPPRREQTIPVDAQSHVR